MKVHISVKTICEEYAAGATLRALGKKYGFSHEWIRQILIRAGQRMRPRAKRRVEHYETVPR